METTRIDWTARGRELAKLLVLVVGGLLALWIYDRAVEARLEAHEMQVERAVLARVDERNDALSLALLRTLETHQERYDWLLHESIEPSTLENWVLVPGDQEPAR